MDSIRGVEMSVSKFEILFDRYKKMYRIRTSQISKNSFGTRWLGSRSNSAGSFLNQAQKILESLWIIYLKPSTVLEIIVSRTFVIVTVTLLDKRGFGIVISGNFKFNLWPSSYSFGNPNGNGKSLYPLNNFFSTLVRWQWLYKHH